MKINSQGTLYVVATPIGNLQDMTFRAVEVLKAVDCIVAEDTRHSQPLLQHFSINVPVLALHEYNERERTDQLLKRLSLGESIALISDAGTPLISDPGYFLVKEARNQNIKVSPIPGACAAIAGLSVSGLPTDTFIFAGFMPVKSGPRFQKLEKLKLEPRTLVFYEAPHRIEELLEALQQVFGERQAVIAREITKLFETITSGSLSELLQFVKSDANQRRGEIVLMVAGADEITHQEDSGVQRILSILLESLPLKQAVEIATQLTGTKKNDIYDTALQIKKDKEG